MNIKEVFEKNQQFISHTELGHVCINRQFTKTEKRNCIIIGNVDLPSGKIRVGDALAYMKEGKFTSKLDTTVKPGSYSVEIAIINTEFNTIRITASRIKLTGEREVRYELAFPTHETAVMQNRDGDTPGFHVDAGVMGFTDSVVVEEYVKFFKKYI